jgi:RHS repeat-associated protein
MVDWTAAGDVAAGSEEVLHYVRDALGSVVGLLDAGQPDATPEPVPAKLVERYDYDPYGKTYIEHWDATAGGGSGAWVRHEPDEPSAFGNSFMWTGQRHDVAIGLYHFPFRTYSPRLGRWLQRDPLGYVDGVNMYAYARSSPTSLIDPLGLTSLLPGAPGSGYDPMLGPFGGDNEIGPPLPPKPEPCDDGTDNPNGDEEDGTGRGGPNGTGPSEEDYRQFIALIMELADRVGLSVGPLDLVNWEAIRAFLDWLMEAFLARERASSDRIPIVDQMSTWERMKRGAAGFVVSITGGPALSSTAAGFWDDTNENWTCTNAAGAAAIVGLGCAAGAGGCAVVGFNPWLGAVAIHAPHAGAHNYHHLQIMIRTGKHTTKHIRIKLWWKK